MKLKAEAKAQRGCRASEKKIDELTLLDLRYVSSVSSHLSYILCVSRHTGKLPLLPLSTMVVKIVSLIAHYYWNITASFPVVLIARIRCLILIRFNSVLIKLHFLAACN
jgi:hypothetical protein